MEEFGDCGRINKEASASSQMQATATSCPCEAEVPSGASALASYNLAFPLLTALAIYCLAFPAKRNCGGAAVRAGVADYVGFSKQQVDND